MDKSYESKYHLLEESNWWFVARRDIILKLIKKLDLKKNAKILEIGCSGGPLLKFLKQNGFLNIYGIDISASAIDLCRMRRIKNVAVMDGAKTQFKNGEFDLIIASDILEHINVDTSALSEWYRLLKPNGRLIIFVPAFNFLWSTHDETNYHYRRYSKSLLLKKLEKANFKINRSSYWNFCLFFPTAAMRILQRFSVKKKSKTKDQLYKLTPLVNNGLIILLKVENWFLKFLNFPIGVSIFAICKK